MASLNARFIQQMLDGVTDEQALKLEGLLCGEVDPEEYMSVQDWVRKCYHRPEQYDLVMCAANEVLGGHGVEGLGVNEPGPQIDYVNFGDPYVNTLVYYRVTGVYRLTSWGDVVETWERHHGREED